MYYYETAKPNGDWMPHTADIKPDTVTFGGVMRMRGGYVRVQRVKEIPPELKGKSLRELQANFEGK
jgi:hypothetical protein